MVIFQLLYKKYPLVHLVKSIARNAYNYICKTISTIVLDLKGRGDL
jgi:hypothetical protein